MKNIFFIAILVICGIRVSAQTFLPPDPKPKNFDYLRIGKMLWIDSDDTTGVSPGSFPGAFVFRQQPGDTSYYFSSGKQLIKLGQYVDSVELVKERIGTTIPIFDTNFVIKSNSKGYTITYQYSLDKLRPKGKRYYVSPSGDNSNDGLTESTPLLSLSTAVGKSDIVELVVLPGVYYSSNAFPVISTKSISVIGSGNPVITTANELVFSRYSAGVFSAPQADALNVIDLVNTDEYGLPSRLIEAPDLSTCQSTRNSWYTDGSAVYVHRTDEQFVTMNNTRVLTNSPSGLRVEGDNVVYVEGVQFEGQETGEDILSATEASGTPLLIANNVTAIYGPQNGLQGVGGHTITVNSTFAYNVKDGQSYQDAAAFVEINSVSYNNGVNGGIDIDNHNGSTAHEASKGVRVNGTYINSLGPNIEDTGSGTETWNINPRAYGANSTRGYGLYSSLGAKMHVWGGVYYENQAGDIDQDGDPSSVMSFTDVAMDFGQRTVNISPLPGLWSVLKDTAYFQGSVKIGQKTSDYVSALDVRGDGVYPTMISRLANPDDVLTAADKMLGVLMLNDSLGASMIGIANKALDDTWRTSGMWGMDSVKKGGSFTYGDMVFITKTNSSPNPVVRLRIKPDGSFLFKDGPYDGSTISAVGRARLTGTGSTTTTSATLLFSNVTPTSGKSYGLNSANNGFWQIYQENPTATRVILDSTGYFGVGGAIPNSSLHVQGSAAFGQRTISANRTLDGTDYIVRTATSGITITLPAASGVIGRVYEIINDSGGSITISSVLVFGSGTTSIPTLTSWRIYSDGTNWRLLSRSN